MVKKTASGYHVPVLLQETIAALQIQPNGVYVDCTFGGGGHSMALLGALGPGGRLLAFDQDADATANLPQDDRLLFIPHNFRHLQRFLRLHKVQEVDGILADLGVSSHQLNSDERGFSTRFAGDLDMRMDRRQELTAAAVLNTYSEPELHRVFGELGEVTNAKTLAKTVVEARKITAFKSITGFRNTVHDIVKGNPHKYFAQVFQALRIEVNDELGALKELLEQVPAALKEGGRVAIITFHSLEDRMVKLFFRQGNFDPGDTRDEFGNRGKHSSLTVITKKPVTPGEREIEVNPRARSAKLRVAEKIKPDHGNSAGRSGKSELPKSGTK